MGGLDERVVRAGVEPSGAAAEDFDVELALREIEAVEVGDLKFAAGGGFERAGERDDLAVVEIEARDGVVGFRVRGFLLDGEHAAVLGKLDDAVGAGIGDVVAEDGGAGGARDGVGEGFHELGAVEKIVAEDERGGFVAGEEADIGGDGESLRETVGAGLLGVAKLDA